MAKSAGSGLILGIESSCDETAAAVVRAGGEVLANVVASQIKLHANYGGVVPELASREHLRNIVPVVRAAMKQASRVQPGLTFSGLDAIAVTEGPGLAGALLVGITYAKALALGVGKPLIAVNHLEGHIHAVLMEARQKNDELEMPLLALVVSGGHTHLYLAEENAGSWRYRNVGRTVDDAAGEAFDKGARLLGLGYPGGAALERLATEGDPEAFDFPSAARMPGLDFSFAGLKTALLYKVRDLGEQEAQSRRADLAAAYQRAIVEGLLIRVRRALKQTGATRLAVGGGVAANGPLREALGELGVELDIPPRALCTDNAAMIASAARFTPALSFPDYLELDVYATGERL